MPQTSGNSYTATAKLFHWLVVVLLIIQYTVGWLMPHFSRSITPGGLIGFHLGCGIVILFLMLGRLIWRLFNPPPGLPENSVPYLEAGARLMHWLIYLFAIIVPLSGWALASLFGWQISIFGFLVPDLPLAPSILGVVGRLHPALAVALIVLLGLHVAAALFHQFILKDNLFARMWFNGGKKT